MPRLPEGVTAYEGPRGKRYVIRYRLGPGGRQVEETIDAKTGAEAAAERQTRLDELRAGTWVPKNERLKRKQVAAVAELVGAEPLDLTGPTFGMLLDEYEKRVKPLKRNQDWQAFVIGVLRSELGAVPLVALTPERVEHWITALRAAKVERKRFKVERHIAGKARHRRVPNGVELRPRLSASSIRKYVFAGSGVFSTLLKSGEIRRTFGIRSNPFANQLLPDEEKSLPRVMRQADIEAFLAACAGVNERLRRWALVLLALGCRVEEAMTLNWKDVDLGTGDVVIRGKTGERYGVLTADGLAMLASWHEADGKPRSGRVLGHAYNEQPKKHWRAAFKRAGLDGRYTARNFRTTFCSRAFNGGARPEDLVAQTGHTLPTLMAYYVALERGRKRAAVAAADFNLEALGAIGSAATVPAVAPSEP